MVRRKASDFDQNLREAMKEETHRFLSSIIREDRSVTDFIQAWFGSWAFPSFIVADAGISVGAALLIIDALFFSGREETQP